MGDRPSKDSPRAQLETLVTEAIKTARVAKRHGKRLDGLNFYANKLADLRADATNSFARLQAPSLGDATAAAELMQRVFSGDAEMRSRGEAARDLLFALKTKWDDSPDNSRLEEGGVFPLVTLGKTKRGYLTAVGRQMNGCYASGWYDGCAVMMRRLLESTIIEAFEARHIDGAIKDTDGNFLHLTGLINKALAEKSWNLPRNVKNELPNLRDLGHRSAHNRYYVATKMDIDKSVAPFRETVEAFLHLARLL